MSEGNLSAIALFTTVHQIGMVFESASGIRFPALVESTTIILGKGEDTSTGQPIEHTQGSLLGLVVGVHSGGVD